jgi:very-short-patch-repair endonuclease
MSPGDPYLGIYSTRRLRALGLARHHVRTAVEDRRLVRIRPGWFSASDAVPDAISAVRLGGVLTATSGSRHLGLWTLGDERIHILVPRNASRHRLGAAVVSLNQPLCLHWSKAALARDVPVADALQILVDSDHCMSRATTVALADSAMNLGLLGIDVVEAALPKLAPWCDPASQSGTESIVRIGLRRRGVSVQIQVWIEGVGFVDLLVGDRLVIECDSASYHEGYRSERDYERDQELMRQGYLVLRLKYRQVVHEWARIEALILAVVRARRHRWRAGTGGTILAL